ncbi:nitric oxide reductase [Vibrio sp. 10N.286.55.E10]|uniref:NADH:flavorubredoxin reductase NorW n=1 Tax=unclassified Vibrio TaxID=2614977 RepID=UPI000C81D22B|nr:MULTISPECIES: NADH:flavorubredoxin reductase NorW [unclassified Vibrio]CAK3774079.1 NADH:flavorubredoxin reductase [Vibrio crassostreae]PME32012.1 nitric oxide reductase [Vibrio sp. 10N.286.55.E10]PME37157.1 nitric oxide reductase [Vibrio sp. 10N.286.55.E12]PME65925.1 nitric oxide reductase [Vibrio sp. 10N.286.55.C11]PTP16181.1 NADH:flavorubredoxin reductase NorW [Vibrio sp. 10N.286.51.C3]
MSNIVIVGGGFAALQTIKMVRKIDQDVAITMITADAGVEYSKPNISHAFSQAQTPQALTVNNAQQLAEQYNVVIKTKALVSEIDTKQQCVHVDGQIIHYSKLVLATGATPFIPPAEGLKRSETITLNSLEEFEKHKAQIDDAQRITVIGGGLIGVELAFDLQTAGKDVTIIEPASYLLNNLVPPFVSLELEGELTKAGVTVETDSVICRATYLHDGVRLQTTTSRLIRADIVIAAAGLRPNTALAAQAGIEANRGIVVDNTLKTSANNVYAIGDCAEVEGRVMAYLQPAILSANVLAKQLIASDEVPATADIKLKLPHIITKVKTPSYPIQLAGRDLQTAQSWETRFDPKGIVAKGFNEDNQLVGFIVTGEHIKTAFPLLKELQTISPS